MPDGPAQRKLTTILVADVEGFSHLVHVDEAATLETLEDYRGAIAKPVIRHEGRNFNTGGDRVLAEFKSAVEALVGPLAPTEQGNSADRDAEVQAIVSFCLNAVSHKSNNGGDR